MTAPRVHKGPHVDTTWDDVVETMHEAMTGAHLLCHMGHYTDGQMDVTVDLLGGRGRDHVECDHPEYVRTARRLSTFVSELERELLPVRTGSLIRVVLQAATGAVYCDSVVPDQHVIAFTRTPEPAEPVTWSEIPAVRAADRLTSGVATELRLRLSRQAQNLGGWLTERLPDADVDPALVPVAPPGAVHVSGSTAGPIPEQCAKVVDPRDLHLVSWWADDEPLFTVDVFEDPKVRRFFNESITVAQRRRFYDALGGRLPSIVTQFGRMCRKSLGGRLERAVLDVEQGAIYYLRVEAGKYLVGVTLNQNEVSPSDDKIARLGLAVRSL
ncbi:hypothetical protein JNUCC0626_20875 [Lentzea sp. JNUCC 0626]|uniref:hypothetical protein n=1 Tax=Lentzea sp. JNUCC 0626 TaxID=3367513 RepID=UPI0037490B7D